MFNSKCTCGCLNVDVYGIVLYFVAFWFMCVCILLELFLVKIVNWLRWTNVLYVRLCHDSGHWPLATEEWWSVSGQAMWNLWWKQWQWDRFFSDCLHFPLLVSFHQCTVLIHPSLVLYNLSNWQCCEVTFKKLHPSCGVDTAMFQDWNTNIPFCQCTELHVECSSCCVGGLLTRWHGGKVLSDGYFSNTRTGFTECWDFASKFF